MLTPSGRPNFAHSARSTFGSPSRYHSTRHPRPVAWIRACAFAVVRMKHHRTACERRESLRISAHPRRTAGRVDTARATPRRQGERERISRAKAASGSISGAGGGSRDPEGGTDRAVPVDGWGRSCVARTLPRHAPAARYPRETEARARARSGLTIRDRNNLRHRVSAPHGLGRTA